MPDFSNEQPYWNKGFINVVGVDEAGRGPLAGPVTAAAIMLPQRFNHSDLNDSKKLTERKREMIFEELIADRSIVYFVAHASVSEIDELNILKATHLAMARAVKGLQKDIDFCLIDGLDVPAFPFPSKGIVKGDGLSLSIAAASVLAKVSRDRLMLEYAKQYPEYGFERHKGYGTKVHLAALENHGASPIHRRSFAPVANAIATVGES